MPELPVLTGNLTGNLRGNLTGNLTGVFKDCGSSVIASVYMFANCISF